MIAERWRPYRTIAAHLFWAFNRRVKEGARGKSTTRAG